MDTLAANPAAVSSSLGIVIGLDGVTLDFDVTNEEHTCSLLSIKRKYEQIPYPFRLASAKWWISAFWTSPNPSGL